jgi:hypothetical protein
VAFRGKNEVMHEFRVPIETPDARYYFPIIKFKAYITDNEIFAREWWASGKFMVDDVVKAFDILIRKP